MLSLITAIASNGVIGKGHELPWHIPEDLKKFKSITTGKTVVMGRKTYKSLNRPNGLPNRRNIVISTDPDKCDELYGKNPNVDFWSYDEFMSNDPHTDDQEYFIIGGAQIYELFLPVVTKLYISYIHAEYDGDVYFPQTKSYPNDCWVVSELEEFDEFSFEIYRKNN